ncbi:MAG: HNH endonuclease [Pyrinomonadaceae bacterium]
MKPPLSIITTDARSAYLWRYHSTGLTHTEVRAAVFKALGPCCACCGETLRSVLTIDHIRPRLGKRRHTWRDVLCAGCPRDKFQILCYNCNQSKSDRECCEHQLKAA